MHKFLVIFIVLLSVAVIATGCGKKEVTGSEAELGMPMSVTVDGSTGTTNLITKTGETVEVGTSQVQPNVMEPMQASSASTASAMPTTQEIQTALKNAGLYTGAVDGKLGPKSKKAITDFQQQNGLTADGKVGSKTWEKLKTYLNQNQQ